jgi:hypothetical protein
MVPRSPPSLTPRRFAAFSAALVRSENRGEPNDIDLVVPEFTDERMYSAEVGLETYERLGSATGKPIDLFFTTDPSTFNLAGWYEHGRWRFRQAFCGKGFFDGLTPMTFEQIVAAARPSLE